MLKSNKYKHQRISAIVTRFLQSVGGKATLEDIERGVLELNPSISEGLEKFDASMRDCIQKYSSDSKKFKYEDLFCNISRGVWGLRENNITLDNTNSNLDDIIKRTEAVRLTRVRLVQPRFREKLINKYGSTCPITNINIPNFLIASHIKPWSKSSHEERLDVNNGILLSVHFDSLFDSGDISFDENGVLICKSLDIKELLNTHFKIKNNELVLNDEMSRYLKWHREYFDFGEKQLIYT